MRIAVFTVAAVVLELLVAMAFGLRFKALRRNQRTESRLPAHFWRELREG